MAIRTPISPAITDALVLQQYRQDLKIETFKVLVQNNPEQLGYPDTLLALANPASTPRHVTSNGLVYTWEEGLLTPPLISATAIASAGVGANYVINVTNQFNNQYALPVVGMGVYNTVDFREGVIIAVGVPAAGVVSITISPRGSAYDFAASGISVGQKFTIMPAVQGDPSDAYTNQLHDVAPITHTSGTYRATFRVTEGAKAANWNDIDILATELVKWMGAFNDQLRLEYLLSDPDGTRLQTVLNPITNSEYTDYQVCGILPAILGRGNGAGYNPNGPSGGTTILTGGVVDKSQLLQIVYNNDENQIRVSEYVILCDNIMYNKWESYLNTQAGTQNPFSYMGLGEKDGLNFTRWKNTTINGVTFMFVVCPLFNSTNRLGSGDFIDFAMVIPGSKIMSNGMRVPYVETFTRGAHMNELTTNGGIGTWDWNSSYIAPTPGNTMEPENALRMVNDAVSSLDAAFKKVSSSRAQQNWDIKRNFGLIYHFMNAFYLLKAN